MEPSRVWYQVNPPGPLQQFLCPLQKINSCLGTSQMAPANVPAAYMLHRVLDDDVRRDYNEFVCAGTGGEACNAPCL